MGDSQTADRFAVLGVGAKMHETYPMRVARRKGYGSVTNVGISGHTTAQMLARFGADVLQHRAGAVSIMGFVNDMTTNISGGVTWTGAGTSVATTKANLKSMVQQAQARRARVTLLSCAPIRETVYLNNVAAYLTACSEIASETGCEYIDVWSAFTALTSNELDALYIAADTNHPNAAGHALISTYGTGNAWGQF
jgi:lysophospholipase L1-like esterase